MSHYDLVVIGSGPAGEKGAAQAAYFGKRVALVEEKALLGGAAANTGTLPSKTLRETSLYLSGYRQRGLHAVEFVLKREANIRDFLHRERLVTAAERGRIARNLHRHGIQVHAGRARFLDDHTVEVQGAGGTPERLTADFFLIATGSRPHHAPPFDYTHPRVRDSDSILEIEVIPGALLVVGGGVIGCEYACMFAALGLPVNLVEGQERLLGFLDGEMSAALCERMADLGIRFHMPGTVASAEATGREVRVTLSSGEPLTADLVLVAAGRSGNSTGLGLEELGIACDARGRIAVNEHYQTAVPHIYAAGDVIGFPALASTSMEQARIAMVHAFDLRYKTRLAPILPYGIYTIPEVSMAGETEESLRARGIDYVVGRARYAENARGQIIGDGGGFLKLIFRRDDMQLVGVHILGESASELVHVGLTAMLTGATAELFIQTCFNYPSLAETYKYATYDALGSRGSSAPR